jgi:twitching motility protein PilT
MAAGAGPAYAKEPAAMSERQAAERTPGGEPGRGVSVADVLRLAVKRDASDAIITAGVPPALRVHGDLFYTKSPPLAAQDTQRLVYDVLTDDQIARFEREKELDFSISLGEEHRFRVNCYWQRDAVGAAFRIIPKEVPDLDELGVPPIMRDLVLRHQGLIMITGPTGHGKSTTQAALIDIVNSEKRLHIVTIEDPIEFLHASKSSVVDQREVGQDTLSFAEALRHVLRQDPDVILIGEMRDLETMRTALTAAETGHLVIATLHTNDAAQSIDRIIDSFPPHQQSQVRAQLSFCLLAILSQRLLPRKGGGQRVLATELLCNNSAVANLIREGKTSQIYGVMETQSRQGMYTMDFSLKDLYLRGVVEREEARRRMRNPQLLDM